MLVRIVVTYDGRERLVGWFDGHTLTCKRTVSKHLFRGGYATVREARFAEASSWGLDCKVCDGLLARGGQVLCIDSDEGLYRCPLGALRTEGFVMNLKHRPQYFLNETMFEHMPRSGAGKEKLNG